MYVDLNRDWNEHTFEDIPLEAYAMTDEEIPEDAEPKQKTAAYLTLYLSGTGRELTLCRKHITMGADKSQDLDLSRMPGARYLDSEHGEFFLKDRTWYLRVKASKIGTWLNDQLAEPGEYPLNRGDQIAMGGLETVKIVDFVYRLLPPVDELDHDIALGFESIHLNNGHVGSETTFIASRRMIVTKKWGVIDGKPEDTTPIETPVPPHIKTEDQLRSFAGTHAMHSSMMAPKREMYDQDVLLWLAPEEEVMYVAEKQEVRWRKWDETSRYTQLKEEKWLRFADFHKTEADLRAYVRRFWPYIPHNRKYDLDEDILISSPWDRHEIKYTAKDRTLTGRYKHWNGGYDESRTESLFIPEDIQREEDLRWYMDVHMKSVEKSSIYDRALYEDMTLSSGKKQLDGQWVRYETVYIADRRTVVHRVYRDQPCDQSLIDEKRMKISGLVFNVEDMKEEVRKNYRDWL